MAIEIQTKIDTENAPTYGLGQSTEFYIADTHSVLQPSTIYLGRATPFTDPGSRETYVIVTPCKYHNDSPDFPQFHATNMEKAVQFFTAYAEVCDMLAQRFIESLTK
jgi:hypothetical protein